MKKADTGYRRPATGIIAGIQEVIVLGHGRRVENEESIASKN